jgi:3-O-methylgallate 3,4-dioxygenase
VAVFGSGGLSHFVIDEALDHAFLDAIRAGDPERMEAYGEAMFQAGTSEIKNWMPVTVGMADLGFRPTVLDYVPCYRSAAGTGNGQGFVYWLPPLAEAAQ